MWRTSSSGEPASVALVGERGVHGAVADHVAAGGQRRATTSLEVLRTVGGGEQRLGPVRRGR